MSWQTILVCTTCGEVIELGPRAMDRADKHEREATLTDPDFRDHWVQFEQVEEKASLP